MAVAVLGYHRIGPPHGGGWDSWYTVPEERFRDHLRWLARNGWEILSLTRFVDAVRDPASLGPRSVLITFDDGYKSLVGAARRCLQDAAAPAVAFVPTDLVGAMNVWDAGTAEPEEPLCDWDDLLALEQAAISVQSHGASHTAFSTLSETELADECGRSRTALEQRLITRVNALAYPFGDAGGPRTSEILRGLGFQIAFTFADGIGTFPPPDPFRIPRVAIGEDTDLAEELKA